MNKTLNNHRNGNNANTVLCGVCHSNHRRLAIKVNNVSICYDCVDFFNNQAKVENKPVMSVIEHQTLYVASLS